MYDWVRTNDKSNKSEGCFVLVNKMYKYKIGILRTKLNEKVS